MLLHCNGDMAEMEALADVAPPLAGKGEKRAAAALCARRKPAAGVCGGDRQRLQNLLARAP